ILSGRPPAVRDWPRDGPQGPADSLPAPSYVGANGARFKRLPSSQAGMRLVGIGKSRGARPVEALNLIGGERPPGRTEIVVELVQAARADDRGGNPRPAEEPVEGDLR